MKHVKNTYSWVINFNNFFKLIKLHWIINIRPINFLLDLFKNGLLSHVKFIKYFEFIYFL